MNVANINMKKGFKSENLFNEYQQKELFFVHNLQLFNETQTTQNLNFGKNFKTCIGVWKVKQLKEQI